MCTRAHGHDSRKLYTYAEQGTLVSMCVLCTCGEGSVCLSMDSRALDDRLNYPPSPPLPPLPLPFIQSLSLSPVSFCRLPVDSVLWTQSGIDSWTKWGGGASPCSCFFASLFDRSFMMQRIAEWIGSFCKGIGFRKRSQNGYKTGKGNCLSIFISWFYRSNKGKM